MSRNKSPLCGTLPFFATVAVMAITASGADSLLLHRWSFNNDFADSAGGQTATATNYSFVAYGGGYAVKTDGGANGTSYIDLGPNILPNDGRSFTFEMWVRLDAWQNSQWRMFRIGSGGWNKFDQTWGFDGQAGDDYTLVTLLPQNSYVLGDRGIGPFIVDSFCHLAYVFSPGDGGRWVVRAYRHGVGTGGLQAKTSFFAPSGWTPSSLAQTYCHLARAFDASQNDSAASFDEVRVWGRALSEAEIAASAIAGPDAVIPGGDTPFGMTVFDTAGGTLAWSSGQTYADDVEKLSSKALLLTGDNVFASSLKAYDGTVVQSGGSLSSAAAPITLGDGLCGSAALVATDGAELNVRGITGNGYGEVVLDDATLRFHGDTASPTLVRRWSFNGNLTDSVGGQTATWKNASFVDCDGGQAVKLSGGTSMNSYVDLGPNVLPADGNGVTVELWARNDALVSNARMFDFGNARNHSAMLCWAVDNVNTDYAIVRYNGSNTLTQHELAPYALGTIYHIAATYFPNGDGTWTVRAYKQDAATGATLKMTTLNAPAGWSLANLVQGHCYLGQGFDSAGSAKATYDEVRIWNGVLTEAQLSANAVAGPDAVGGGEVKSSTAMVGGVTVKVGASGATIDTNGKDVVLADPLASLANKNGLVHRWSFNGDLSDSVGVNTATATGCSFVDVGGGQGIKLSGGTHGTTCVDLGANIVPVDGNGATIELWARVDDNSVNNVRMFDFGSSTWHAVLLCWRATAANTDYAIVRLRSGLQTLTQNKLSPYVEGTLYHIAVTISPDGSGGWMLRGYKQDAVTGATLASTAFNAPSGWTLSGFVQTHAYLGRTFDGDNTKDANATYDEVRIYNRVLSEAELTASAAAGPDADLSGGTLVKKGEGALVLDGTNTLMRPLRVEAGTVKAAIAEALSANSVVELCEGTALDLGGNSATAGGLTGGGAVVSNGTLSVTRAICPAGEIVLDGADVSGTLEVTSDSGLLRRVNGAMDLSAVDLVVKSVSPNGQTIIECADGFTGNFATVSMPSNNRLLRSATKIRVVRPGSVVIIK